jgi:hypothetical protein
VSSVSDNAVSGNTELLVCHSLPLAANAGLPPESVAVNASWLRSEKMLPHNRDGDSNYPFDEYGAYSQKCQAITIKISIPGLE